MKHHSIEILAHQELTEADLGELRQLFGSECLKEFGERHPQQPYGRKTTSICADGLGRRGPSVRVGPDDLILGASGRRTFELDENHMGRR